MPIELPDVNVLIPLIDPVHIHHNAAQAWFQTARAQGWATCPFTEAGLIRIMGNSTYQNGAVPFAEIAARLQVLISANAATHHYWEVDLTLRDTQTFALGQLRGHNQLADLYLLALCQQNNGVLVTFDVNIRYSLPALINPAPNLVRLLTAP